MKLELKHLAPYLPYSLKIKTKYGWATMITLNEWNVNGDCEDSYSYEDHPNEVLEFKPILRPLSDFKKDLYSETFKTFNLNWQNSEDFCLTPVSINSVSYELANILIKIHFDVFGLIEKGLAIDINTI